MSMRIAVPLWIGTFAIACGLQNRLFGEHRRRGGEMVSTLTIVGFIVAGAALTIGGAIGAAYLHEARFGDSRFEVNSSEEVLYSKDVTEGEARALARVLQQHQYFNGVGEKTVRLSKNGPDYVLSLILLSGFEDPEIHQELRLLGGEVSHALGGRPVRVEMCDQMLKPKKVLPPERSP
jgi:hypothetical protein